MKGVCTILEDSGPQGEGAYAALKQYEEHTELG